MTEQPTADLFQMLSPEDPVAFCRGYLGRRLLHRTGHADALSALFNWDDLNRVLATERLDPNRLKITRQGKVIPFPLFAEKVPQLIPSGTPRRLKTHAVAERLAAGDTLIIDAVEELHPPLRAFVQHVEQVLRCFVQVNVYVSAGTTEGFAVHWDDHDVWALQTAGRKSWRVIGPTLPQPLLEIAPPPPPASDAPAAFDGELQTGDILYIPRGWWHSVRAVGEPTIHLAVSARLPQVLDLVRTALTDAARSSALLRGDLPVHANPAEREEWLAQLTATLREVLSAPALAQLPMWADAPPVPVRPLSNLPLALGTRDAWRQCAARKLRLRIGEVDHGALQKVRDLAKLGDAYAQLAAGATVTVGQLLPEPDDEVRAVLTEAVRQATVELL